MFVENYKWIDDQMVCQHKRQSGKSVAMFLTLVCTVPRAFCAVSGPARSRKHQDDLLHQRHPRRNSTRDCFLLYLEASANTTSLANTGFKESDLASQFTCRYRILRSCPWHCRGQSAVTRSGLCFTVGSERSHCRHHCPCCCSTFSEGYHR